MKNVLLRGPFVTKSGYGVHSRQIARWALARPDVDVTVQALPWGSTPWYVDPNAIDGLIGRLLERCRPSKEQPDVSVQLQLPNEWDPKLAKFNVGMSAIVETDRCNPKWCDACNAMDMVIVPSTHAKQCLLSSGVINKPVHVVPEAYIEALDSPTTIDPFKFSTTFNILVVGQVTGTSPENDRKNLFNTVKWLCEAFKDDVDLGIILKTNSGRDTLIDRNVVINTFSKLLSEVRKGKSPRLHLVHGDLNDVEMAALYRHPSIRLFLTLTRGEGFGLPILEAAAARLPIMAPGWSGHMDFLSKGKFINVHYKVEDIPKSRTDDAIFMKGARWAQPSEEDFKRRILKFRQNTVIPTEWAKDLALMIKKDFSRAAIETAYDEILGKVL